MSKCPKCGAQIDHLNNWQSGEVEYRLHLDGTYEAKAFSADGGINEYECPKCKKIVFLDETDALEFLKSAKDDTTLAIDIERPITDEVADAIAKEAEEYHKRKEQEADKAPINIYWRKAQGEPVLQTAAFDFPSAERKRDELTKAGCIDIQMIVKGKKKEVIRIRSDKGTAQSKEEPVRCQ